MAAAKRSLCATFNRKETQKVAGSTSLSRVALTIRPMISNVHARPWLALNLLGVAVSAAYAQSTPAPQPATAAQAAPATPATPATAGSTPTAPRAASQTIEVTGGRSSDVDQRRQSTSAKIIIGREEIDKFGDSSVGEVLRRLPGVTTPGPPGRGGPPRLRGLGSGFTQLLIDGQRVAPGFSLDSLTPDQVERIEILRAPTAETGAQAIAGTINIVTREGFKRRLNDLRIGTTLENGKSGGGLNWTHNDSAGNLVYNISGSAVFPRRESENLTRTTVNRVDSIGSNADVGALLEDRTGTGVTTEKRFGSNLASRLQWRLGEGGDSVSLNPSIFHTEGESTNTFKLQRDLSRANTPGLYDFGTSKGSNRFTNARLGLQLRKRVGPVRLEVNSTGGSFRAVNDTLRTEFNNGSAAALRVLSDSSDVREKSLSLSVKGTGVSGGKPTGGGEHSLVGGVEVDASKRDETRISRVDGKQLFTDFGDSLEAQSLRLAGFIQDEWAINPNWSTQAGLRWEGITTRGAAANTTGGARPTNRSSVLTPLLNGVWKFDPKKRDQMRFSLTRSYRPPTLGNLIAKPSINRDYPTVPGENRETSPDTAGNPNLKPELATGLDVALERYLDSGGVLSANVFHRQISNLMRGVTQLESVSWSPGVQRYVRRMQNIGDATTSGVELEAKFRLDQLVTGAPGVELRGNLSLFDSKVKSVPGPNNRLDQQAKATGNIGADYRMRGTPLTLGGNANWVPGYTTQVDSDQRVTVSTKVVWDAYALWTFNPSTALRLLGSNLDARDFTNTTRNDSVGVNGPERTTVRSTGPSYVNWQLRLELKL